MIIVLMGLVAMEPEPVEECSWVVLVVAAVLLVVSLVLYIEKVSRSE